MAKIYLMIYNVNYTGQTKYKAFTSFEKATNFHRTYKHHILNKKNCGPKLVIGPQCQEAFITHYKILALDLDLTEQTYIAHEQGNCSVEAQGQKHQESQ